jgi:hypothetical protein
VTDSLIPISDEQAKLGQEIIKALRGLGSFVEKALGSTPEDLIGYLGGDWLHIRRAVNIAGMLHKARERLVALGMNETTPAPLSLALPILQGAADEDREALVDLWARLLASAMAPATRNSVRRAFIAAVKEMDPADAKAMHHLHIEKMPFIVRADGGPNSVEAVARQLHYRRDDVEVSVEHLAALQFLANPGFAMANERGETFRLSGRDKDTNSWVPSAKLREFMRACYPELDV